MLMFDGRIKIKSKAEIEAMRTVGRMTAETLFAVDEIIAPGISTEDIDKLVYEHTKSQGCIPAPLNYKGFPKSCCTSINEVVCHGIPTESRILEDGDIINVDVSHIHNGFHGDTSATFYVGEPSEEAKLVTEVSRRCLELGIAEVKPNARLGDIGAAIQGFAEAKGCSVVRDFTGHGIGRAFHEDPSVHHVGIRGKGKRLKPGMTFTIEPMINIGDWKVRILEDDWTAVTTDGTLSAQFEHTLLVTDSGCEILTPRPGPLTKSERFPDYWS
jgi:methionyl aminopeptidase